MVGSKSLDLGQPRGNPWSSYPYGFDLWDAFIIWLGFTVHAGLEIGLISSIALLFVVDYVVSRL
jgi:hypothetical protein